MNGRQLMLFALAAAAAPATCRIRVRVNPGFSPALLAKRLALTVTCTLALTGLCIATKNGVLALAVPILCSWPHRQTLEVDAAGITVRWLMLKAHLPAESIRAVEWVAPQPFWPLARPHKKKTALRIHCHDRPSLFVRASRSDLDTVAAAIESVLQARRQRS